jgi:hypothetical protein
MLRICGEVQMLSKLMVALALLALSLVLGSSPSYAEEVATIACPAPSLDIAADEAEAMDVLCQSQPVVIAWDVADLSGRFPSADEEAAPVACPAPALDIAADLAEVLDVLCQTQSVVSVAADVSVPAALEGQAIRVEITQSVTIAVLRASSWRQRRTRCHRLKSFAVISEKTSSQSDLGPLSQREVT